MSSFAALLRSRVNLRAACSQSNSVKLQLALQQWQLCSGCRAFSASAGDEDGDGRSFFTSYLPCPDMALLNHFLCSAGETTPVSHRGSWRTWVDEQLSGVAVAACSVLLLYPSLCKR